MKMSRTSAGTVGVNGRVTDMALGGAQLKPEQSSDGLAFQLGTGGLARPAL